MTIPMRDGSVADDVRLGRLEQFDEKSRNFTVRELLQTRALRKPRGRAWMPGPTLDQNGYGSCVWFSIGHRLRGTPVHHKGITADVCYRNYRRAQQIDPWPETFEGGEEGTSVLAGLKIAQQDGLIGEYRWVGAGSDRLEDDIVETLGYIGGINFGVPWPRSAFEVRPSGLLVIDLTSGFAGGHAIYAPASRLRIGLPGEPQLRGVPLIGLQNSWPESAWGVRWAGVDGCAWARLDDWLGLLERGGEGAVVTELRPGR